MMKIGFIGTGNMASAIINGIISKEYISNSNIYCTELDQKKLNDFCTKTGVNQCKDNNELIETVDYLILAVKPHIIPQILRELKDNIIKNNNVIISIAAGVSIEQLEDLLSDEISIVRVMPNVNAMIGAGVAAVCCNNKTTSDQTQIVIELFEAVGTAYELAEKDFSTFIGIAGSSPAFAYLFIDSLARAAVKNGLPKDQANKIAAQAVLGSAKMILESDQDPWQLINMVCSPGGTTVAGIVALEDEKFISTVIKGVDVTIAKDKEMLKKDDK